MGNPDQVIDVSIIFLIAMHNPGNQVKVLQGLTQIFRQSNVLQNILAAKNSKEVLAILLSSMDRQE
jgi:PTS system galactitol-specific IIA component